MVWSQISVHIRPANKCLARCCEVLTSLFPLLSDGVQFQLRLQPFTWHPKRQMRKDHRKVYDMPLFVFVYKSHPWVCSHYSETSIKRTPSGPSQVSAYIEVVKIAQCLLTINFQRLLCTVIKLHVVKEAIQSSSSLPFITKFNLFVTEKTLTDFSPYFKDVIRYYYCQFSPCLLNRGF